MKASVTKSSFASRTVSGGSFSDSEWLGNPSIASNRQYSSMGTPGYYGGDNIVADEPGPTADIYMVPDFQGMSGQGNNQSTDRPKGSI